MKQQARSQVRDSCQVSQRCLCNSSHPSHACLHPSIASTHAGTGGATGAGKARWGEPAATYTMGMDAKMMAGTAVQLLAADSQNSRRWGHVRPGCCSGLLRYRIWSAPMAQRSRCRKVPEASREFGLDSFNVVCLWASPWHRLVCGMKHACRAACTVLRLCDCRCVQLAWQVKLTWRGVIAECTCTWC